MQPSVKGQALSIQRAYEKAEHGQHVYFVEAHGTGTRVGDRTELEGLARVAAEKVVCATPVRDRFDQVDHRSHQGRLGCRRPAEGDRRRESPDVPPTASCEDPNATFETTAQGIYPILLGEVRSPNETLRAGVSGFGFGGINAHLLD